MWLGANVTQSEVRMLVTASGMLPRDSKQEPCPALAFLMLELLILCAAYGMRQISLAPPMLWTFRIIQGIYPTFQPSLVSHGFMSHVINMHVSQENSQNPAFSCPALAFNFLYC
jgi:hypothetical protein